jgi:REP element-mobilizing transposase RayT
VEVLAYCVLGNHFHLLVRVPHRADGFVVLLAVIAARLEQALGETAAAELGKQLEFWRTTKNESAIEE